MKQWRLQHGESYLITGQPVIVADLTGKITHSIELLLVAVMLVMALTLSLIFRGRPRLLPLGIALLAAALTFGALSVVGASLTVASIAVLPVLVGLAVDYAIQFQSRVEEAFAEEADGLETHRLGAHPPGRRARGGQARGRPRPRRRSPRPGSRASRRCWSCCSRRCRWYGASGCCWRWAS